MNKAWGYISGWTKGSLSRPTSVIAVSVGSLMLIALVVLAMPVAGHKDAEEGASESAAPDIGNAEQAPRAAAPAGSEGEDPPPVGAVWEFRPQSVQEMTERAEAIVIGRVTSVKRGPFIHPRATTDSTGEGALPTQRIRLRASRVLSEGLGIDVGSAFTLFRTGGTRETGMTLELEGDPEYQTGSRYALFLRKRDADDGTLLPVAPDGRLRLSGGDRLTPLVEGSVGEELGGRTVDELEALIDG